MNKALNFVRLDFLTVKPYFTLKNLLIFTALPIIFIIDSSTSAVCAGMIMMFAVIYVSYPFAIGEKNGIDTLYPTLSIKRSAVVLGRYVFSLTVVFCGGIAAFVYSLVAMTIFHKSFNALETVASILILFIVCNIIQAIQLPIYFKLGYSKAKLLAYLPIAFIISISFFNNGLTAIAEWISAYPIMAATLAIIAWLGIMVISFHVSLAFYKKRDF